MTGMVIHGDAQPMKGIATAAAAKPPSTSAPSPPITTMPRRAGTATQSAVRMSGAERTSVFSRRTPCRIRRATEARRTATGDLPSDEQEDREENGGRHHGKHRDNHRLGGAGDAPKDIRRRYEGRRRINFGRGGRGHVTIRLAVGEEMWPAAGEEQLRPPATAQVIEPTTPSTR